MIVIRSRCNGVVVGLVLEQVPNHLLWVGHVLLQTLLGNVDKALLEVVVVKG